MILLEDMHHDLEHTDNNISTTYNDYTILKRVENTKDGRKVYLCQCKCGNKKRVVLSDLKRQAIKSCGCYHKEKVTTHGLSNTSFYRVWVNMNARCNNVSSISYPNYGGRGIKCEWLTFKDFKHDMFSSYVKGLEIDRIDNEKNYFKDNCRWVSHKQNSMNKRQTIKYKNLCARQASEILGGSSHLVQRRISRGWDKHEAFTRPVIKK